MNSGNTDSTGDGIVMKVAPLSFFFALMRNRISEKDKEKQIEFLAKMTHKNNFCACTAIIYSKILETIFQQSIRNPDYYENETNRKQLLMIAVDIALEYEKKIPLDDQFKSNEINYLLSARFVSLLDSWNAKGELTDQDIIKISNGASFFTVDCVTAVVALFAQQNPSFQTVVKAAYFGGDTDTTAAMVSDWDKLILAGGVNYRCDKGCRNFPRVSHKEFEEFRLYFGDWKGVWRSDQAI